MDAFVGGTSGSSVFTGRQAGPDPSVDPAGVVIHEFESRAESGLLSTLFTLSIPAGTFEQLESHSSLIAPIDPTSCIDDQISVGCALDAAPGMLDRLGDLAKLRRLPGSLGDDIIGLSDDYVDITNKGSRARNVQTSVGRSTFEDEVVESGFTRNVLTTDSKNIVEFQRDGARYVVRDAETSTGGLQRTTIRQDLIRSR